MTFSIQWLASLAPIWFSFSEVSLIHTECCAALLSHPPENCSLMYGLPPLCKTTYPNPAPLSLWNCFLAMHCAQTKNGLLKTTFLPQVVVWNSLPHVDLPDSIQLRFDRETKSLDFLVIYGGLMKWEVTAELPFAVPALQTAPGIGWQRETHRSHRLMDW